MLDFIYWPISAVLWFWREVVQTVFGLFGNPDAYAGVVWVLAIVLLTWTIKALLLYPTIKQLRSSRKMQQLAPQMKAVREKYKNDQTKLAQESQKIYKDAGVRPLAGCLPMLVQIPVFIGLFHVLRSFNRTGEGYGGLGMTAEENRNTANYIFSPEAVQSFLDASIFGAPLASSISMSQDQYVAFPGSDLTRLDIMFVAVPMMLLIAVVTHLNARMSLERQETRKAAGKTSAPTGDNAEMMEMQQNMMGKMMLWVMPAFTLVTGFVWTIGLLVYMASNTLWTFVQQRLVFAKMDREEAEEEEARMELKRTTAPVPGARKVEKQSRKERSELNETEQKQQAEKDRQAAQNARSSSKKKKKKKK